MPYALIVATVLQTLAIFIFQFLLIPKKYTAKRSLTIMSITMVLLAIAASICTVNYGTSFMVTYGFLIIGIPFFVVLYALSAARGLRFLFIVLTAMILQEIVMVILSMVRLYVGFSGWYFIIMLFVLGGIVGLGYYSRKEFQKILFAYKQEFIYLSIMLTILFVINSLFMPITEENILDEDLFFVSIMLYVLVISIYLYVIVSFRNLSRQYDFQHDALLLRQQTNEAILQINFLQTSQEQMIIYRHDMRHHLALLSAFAADGNMEKVKEYLAHTQMDLNAMTHVCYCKNDMVNLIMSSYVSKASKLGVALRVEANLPQSLPLLETELCTILSNGLENAVMAAAQTTEEDKTVLARCCISGGNLLIHLENPYVGDIEMQDGMPQSHVEGHGFGVKSMVMLVKKYDGYCAFEPQDGIFTLKIALPLGKLGADEKIAL